MTSPLTRGETRAIAEKVKAGLEYAEISKMIGRHETNIRAQVPKKSVDQTLEAFEWLDQGMTLAEVGEKMGVSRQRVGQMVGVEPDRATRGRKVVIDAAEETWVGIMPKLDAVDIRIRGGEARTDTRAVTQLLDMIASGKIELKRAKIKK